MASFLWSSLSLPQPLQQETKLLLFRLLFPHLLPRLGTRLHLLPRPGTQLLLLLRVHAAKTSGRVVEPGRQQFRTPVAPPRQLQEMAVMLLISMLSKLLACVVIET